MPDALLSPDVLAKLEQLDFVSRKMLQGHVRGERRSTRKGRSVEFADYRSYVQGDDLRFVDWNIAARLDRLFVKLFLEEEDLHFYTLVDNSPSMDFGDPTKLHVARQIAAALGFIGLIRSHRVCLETLGRSLKAPSPIWRGRHNAWRMFQHLTSTPPTEKGSLLEGVKNFTLRHSGRGILVLITDLMDKQGYEEALRYLSARRLDTYVVHILSREELQPDVAGELRLIDCEDEQAVEVTVGEPLVKAYDRTLKAFLREAEEFCKRRGLHYTFVDNQSPVEKTVADTLRRHGLVRR
ncbi:MAG: DUF58 domain-containing protein [Pirellulales bacterium]